MLWDLNFSRRLRLGTSQFQLSIAWRSDARRLVLFGPSGAGKTQTLRVLAGLAAADQGHARLAGDTLFDTQAGIALSPQQRRLAYMFQDYALFPHLSLRQNIAFGRHPGWTNPPRRTCDEVTEQWIERFRLQSVADHLPHQVSGGQRQRTALARALVTQPRALLLDEPFAALDKALRRRLREELSELQSSLKMPLIVITHDDDDVQELADEVLHLFAGQVMSADEAAARAAEA